jgi:hypothetical protein
MDKTMLHLYGNKVSATASAKLSLRIINLRGTRGDVSFDISRDASLPKGAKMETANAIELMVHALIAALVVEILLMELTRRMNGNGK